MSHLLWKFYLEDDIESFCRLLRESGSKARPPTQKYAVSSQSTLKIGASASFGSSLPGPATSFNESSIGSRPDGREYHDVVLSRQELNRRDGKGMTLLHHAVSSSAESGREFALALISHPLVDLFSQDWENGWTALHRAFYFGNITVARAILEREAQDLIDVGHGSVTGARLIRVKDVEGNGPFDLLTETIKDRTLHHQDMNAHFTGNGGEEEGDDQDRTSPDEAGDGSRIGLVPPGTNLEGDELFMFGSNKNVTLGLGNEDDRQYPERVSLRRPEHLYRRFMREHFERRATASAQGSAAHAEKLRGVSRANNAAGVVPSVIKAFPLQIQDVQMSKFHSGVLTSDPASNLYMTGHGPGGRLGTGDERTQFSFVCVEDFGGARKKIAAIGLGQDHTLAVTSLGELFTWGSNQYGQLGTGMSKTSMNAEEPLQLVPKQIFGVLKKEVIIGVAASRTHSVVHTSSSLYTFGKNEGQLGIVDAHAGTLEVQSTPRKVAASRFSCVIQSVSAIDKATVCLLENHEVHVFANYGAVKLQFPLDGFTNYFLKNAFNVTRYDEKPNTIVKVTCGGDTICALSSSGEIFAVTVDQRVDPASSSTSSTTNPNKIRAALSSPARIWSLKKGHMNARDVGVDHDGSIVLTTEAGSVWRRVRRTQHTVKGKGEKKSKDFKFSRVPGLTRVTAVRASASGAYCSVRRDCDVTKEQIAVQRSSLWTDVGSLLPFKHMESLESERAQVAAASFWTRPTKVQKIVASLAGSSDPEKDIDTILKSQSNEYCSNYDAVVKTTVSDIEIPVHAFVLAARSPILLDGFVSAQRAGSWANDILAVSIDDQGKATFRFLGIDFLTMIELILYIYTDEFVGFWLRARNASDLAPRYRQTRVEIMKVAGRLDMHNLESAARRMAQSAPPSMNHDFEQALAHWSFLDSGDIAIQLADGDQLVHSDLLSRRCPFFEGLFQGRAGGRWLAERRQQLADPVEAVDVDFTHVELATFKLVLRHLYADTGEELFDEIMVSSLDDLIDVVLDVLSLANELMLDRLSQICQKVLGRYVNVRNVCSFLNAVAPSAVDEFKTSALEYICLNLEGMLTTQLLDELDEDLLHDLDEVVRGNQLNALPFAKSGRADALLLERYPELAARIDRDRQAKVDTLTVQAKFTDNTGMFSSSVQDEDEDNPFLQRPRRMRPSMPGPTPSKMESPSTPRTPRPRDPSGMASPSPSPLSPTVSAAAKADAEEAVIGSPEVMRSMGSPAIEDERSASGHGLVSPTESINGGGWSASLITPTKLGMKEIMEQASSNSGRKSGITLGLASQAGPEARAAGSFTSRMSQKERKRQQQRQASDNLVSSSPAAPSPILNTPPSTASPWQTVQKPESSTNASPLPAEASVPKPPPQRSGSTPHMTMRQTIANAPSSKKGKDCSSEQQSPLPSPAQTATQPTLSSPQTTPSSRPSRPGPPPTTQSESASTPISIKSVRHTPRPDAQLSPSFYMHQSMADIVAQQEAEKTTVKEAVAKRSLQEIQQEQEFLDWWDAESRRAKEEEKAAVRAAERGGKGRGGGMGGGGRGGGSSRGGRRGGRRGNAAPGNARGVRDQGGGASRLERREGAA